MARALPILTLALTTCAASWMGCDRKRADEAMPPASEPDEPAGDPPTVKAMPRADDASAPVVPTRGMRAEAELEAADGQKIEGEAEFYDTGTGVRVVAEIEDAKPGLHGIHVHERGDCSNIKGKSMGGHFAPEGHDHALPAEATARHLGDLGNIEVTEDGEGRLEVTVPRANLKPGDAKSFLGKALVIHMGKDSGKSKQPSGDSGDPIACGVIEET